MMSGEKIRYVGGGIKLHTEGGSFKLDSGLCCSSLQNAWTQRRPRFTLAFLSFFFFFFLGKDQSSFWWQPWDVLGSCARAGCARENKTDRRLIKIWKFSCCKAHALKRPWNKEVKSSGGGVGLEGVRGEGRSFKSLHSPPVKLLPVCENKAGSRLATQESA